MKTLRSAFCICVAAVLWGGIGLVFRPLKNLGYSSLQIIFLRVSVGAVGMAVYIALSDPCKFYVRIKDLWMFIGSGIVSLALFNFCYFQAIDRLSSSVAASLLYTAPMYWLYTKGLEHIRASNASVIATVEPIVAALIGCFIFHDDLSIMNISGICMIVLSICILNITILKRKRK